MATLSKIVGFTVGVVIAFAWAYALLLLVGIVIAAVWNYTLNPIGVPLITTYQGAGLFLLSRLLVPSATPLSGFFSLVEKLLQRKVNNRRQVVETITKCKGKCEKHSKINGL